MYRRLSEWMDPSRMWVTEQSTFERAMMAVGLELERKGMVSSSFTRVVLDQETIIPSGVSDVAVPVAVIDVPISIAKRDGISLLHLLNTCKVKTITGETIQAKAILLITATNESKKQSYHKLIDDLLMDDESLQALVHVKSRAGLFHLQANFLEAFSY
ncbi:MULTISPECIES: PTS sugar transporter subunit IIA [Exiguobacterium]|uniref:PTS sugar transporter subunit IIA n=1 Tax=Exiguobacterium profundum TaxID=307643 RepID=A0ABY8AY73_9BACL|nr:MULTISPECIES: PTS sugar transporter subunit IIA [Exiguobacterium]MBQ6458749.1 PTS sugar transporter subunit IIA [Exiguobacterium sp.]WED54621.1 PTS sugar transporter subunit IIA [Exiguobacterium profundum]